jgi:single-stranded-DNA-specific exonuclease
MGVSTPPPRWIVDEPDADAWRPLARAHRLHPLAAQILVQRGIDSPETASSFLEPTLSEQMPDPAGLADLGRAVDRILDAIRHNDAIAIHGDYDVDGLTGTALLVEALRALGADPNYVIPHRLEDGYGLSTDGIQQLVDAGTDLLITVDCGVTATDEIEKARAAGMDVIVIDHHHIDGELPRAHSVINPRRHAGDYPFDALAAVGVAFNLAVGLRAGARRRDWLDRNCEPDIKSMLDLVALGTIGDVVPLRETNRLFVKRGLELIRRRTRPGIAAILAEACRDESVIDASTVGYQIAPHLNAAGRIGDATSCVELLTTDDARRASDLAGSLKALNKQRKSIQSDILTDAERRAADQAEHGQPILIVSEAGWHRGVLGVVAGRLSDAWHRPAIVLSEEDGLVRGSARSIEGIDITGLFKKVRTHLTEFGGHAEAAGLTLAADRLDAFRRDLRDAFLDERAELPTPSIDIDGTVQLSELTTDFGRDLSKLGPFGAGLPEPVFVARGLEASGSQVVGSGNDHLQVTFDDGQAEVRAIGFSMADQQSMLDTPVDAVFTPKFDIFRGRERVEMHLRSLRPADDA